MLTTTISALPTASSTLGATRRPSRDKDSVFDEVRFHTVVSNPLLYSAAARADPMRPAPMTVTSRFIAPSRKNLTRQIAGGLLLKTGRRFRDRTHPAKFSNSIIHRESPF